MNFTSIWKQSKKEIKSKIPDHAYSTWVDPIKLIGFNDNVLRLEVPNQFFFNWIQSHYHSLFISTFSNLSNLNIDIKYTVSPVQKLNKDDELIQGNDVTIEGDRSFLEEIKVADSSASEDVAFKNKSKKNDTDSSE